MAWAWSALPLSLVHGQRLCWLKAGYDPLTASQIAHGIVAATCFISALIFYIGLKPGTPGNKEERPPVFELIKSGYTEAVQNKRIALAYACGFVARSDQVILGTFTVLWGTTVGVSMGMDLRDRCGQGRIDLCYLPARHHCSGCHCWVPCSINSIALPASLSV